MRIPTLGSGDCCAGEPFRSHASVEGFETLALALGNDDRRCVVRPGLAGAAHPAQQYLLAQSRFICPVHELAQLQPPGLLFSAAWQALNSATFLQPPPCTRMNGLSLIGPRNTVASRCSAQPRLLTQSESDTAARRPIPRQANDAIVFMTPPLSRSVLLATANRHHQPEPLPCRQGNGSPRLADGQGYCTRSPCRAVSRPSVSSSRLTRNPTMASTILRMIQVAAAQNTVTAATP